MKKNSFYGMMMFVATLLTAGCTADYADSSQGLVPIYLTATVNESGGNATTRAAADLQGAQLASGTTFAAEFTGSDVTVNSVTYTADGNGGTSSVAPSQPYFKLSGTSTTVHAYAPSKPSGTFSVQANQSGDDNYKASDLMYATANITKSGSSATGSLTFTHKMAKILVTANIGAGVTNIQSIKIVGGYRTINISTPLSCTLGTSLSNPNSSTNITMWSGTSTNTVNCAALIPPQTISGNFLQIVTDKGTVTYSLSSKAFASGQSYTFNITVNAAAVGTTIAITNWANNGSATVNPTVVNEVYRQAVDLGLPSGTKWANMNVGASSPTDYGMYFMWGDVAGHPGVTTDGFSFDWANYKWGTSSSSLTKYTSSDGKTTLEAADDAATANWGSPWRMPTQTEMQELANTRSNTTDYTWTWCNGSSVKYNNTTVIGWKIESKKSGTAGNHIFLPAAGRRSGASVDGQGSYARYWTSTPVDYVLYRAWYLGFGSSSAAVTGYDRVYGSTVRAVWDPYTRISDATSSDVGKVICSNGHIHATVSAVDCGGTASGIIAYVGDAGSADKSSGSGSYKGLALALYDYGGSLTSDGTTCKWYYTANSGTCITNGQSSTLSTVIGTTGDFGKGIDNTNRLATAACGSGHTHAAAQNAKNFSVARPTGASQWFLPTMYQWNLMVKAMCGKSTDLTTSTNNDYKADKFNEKITAAGGRGVLSTYYWSSVECNTGRAWYLNFGYGLAYYGNKYDYYSVRAVFAF